MTVKLDLLRDWHRMPAGEALLLPSDHEDPRKISIDLNCEDQTWVYCSHGDAEKPQFLAVAGPGLEEVVFWAAGDLAITFAPAVAKDQESQVWVYTAELEPNVGEVPDAVSFTEIHERRARNPELEMMQLIARQNERRMEEQLAQMEAVAERLERANNGTAGTSDGAAGAAGEQSEGGDGTSSGENKAGASEPVGGANDDPAA